MTHPVYLAFGSNLGNRQATYREAIRALTRIPGTVVKACSRLYETEPIELSDNGGAFLNAAIALETDLSPRELMREMTRIEADLGKSPTHTSDMSRMIDLDLLLYDDWHVHEENLEVPHPRMHTRAFVLIPLAEIAAHAVHPTLHLTVEQLVGMLPASDLHGVCPLSSAEPGEFPDRDACSAKQG
ncbi:MAG: 2-amino-4-hydroxy-6-hydroxymethyldihydropteridine diphosphokinase [Deltaproteobacteria bacterium]